MSSGEFRKSPLKIDSAASTAAECKITEHSLFIDLVAIAPIIFSYLYSTLVNTHKLPYPTVLTCFRLFPVLKHDLQGIAYWPPWREYLCPVSVGGRGRDIWQDTVIRS